MLLRSSTLIWASVFIAFTLSTSSFGQEKDADGDGVPDSKDLCPQLAGPATNNGCPVENKPAPVSNGSPNAGTTTAPAAPMTPPRAGEGNQLSPARLDEGTVVFDETFDNNAGKWPIRTEAEIQSDIVDGTYEVATGVKQNFTVVRGVKLKTDAPFSMALTMQTTGTPTSGGSGLMFGTNPQGSTFLLLISNEATWALMKIQDRKLENLSSWTPSRYLNRNGSNLISLKSAKGIWTIYLNGQAVKTMPELPFFGAGLGIFQAAGTKIRFDDLRVQSWPLGASYAIAIDEGKFLPAVPVLTPQAAPVKSPSAINTILDRPFGTKSYAAHGGNTVPGILAMTEKAGEGKLRWGEKFRFTGQQGTTSLSELSPNVIVFKMGDYDSVETARDVAGEMLVAARTVFGNNSVYYAGSQVSDLEETYYVASTDQPRLQASTTVSSNGHFDGKASVEFNIQLFTADPKPANDPATQKNRPQPKPADRATLPPRSSLAEALKSLLAAAPANFAAVSSKTANGLMQGTLHIQGVDDQFQSVIVLPPIAIFSIPVSFALDKEGTVKNVETLTPIIKTALGLNTRISTQEKNGGTVTRFENGNGPYITIESTPNTIGRGFTQQILVHNQ